MYICYSARSGPVRAKCEVLIKCNEEEYMRYRNLANYKLTKITCFLLVSLDYTSKLVAGIYLLYVCAPSGIWTIYPGPGRTTDGT